MLFNKLIFLNQTPVPPTPPLEIVPWSTGTEAQITAMIEALDNGTLTFTETGWSVGDTRTVQLSATEADSERGIEAHSAQSAELVIMDTTCTGFTINGNTPRAIVGLKDGLLEKGNMNTTSTNVGGWKDCKRRSWCNTEFKNSLPTEVRKWFKQFSWSQGAGGTPPNGLHTTQDYFALAPERCIFNSRYHSFAEEAELYTQWTYYSISSNRIKKVGTSGSASGWWECSPLFSADPSYFCNVYSTGSSSNGYASVSRLLSPFGCI